MNNIKYFGALTLVFLLSGCKYHAKTKLQPVYNSENITVEEVIAHRTRAISNPAKNVEFMNSYIKWSDNLCQAHLNSISDNLLEIENSQRRTNIIGDGILAAAGLADASAKAVGGGILIKDTFINYLEGEKFPYVLDFSSIMPKFVEKVKSGRKSLESKIKENLSENENFDNLENTLNKYHETCNTNSLNGFIQEMIANSEIVPDSPSDEVSITDRAKVLSASSDIHKILFNEDGIFTDKELKSIYMITSGALEVTEQSLLSPIKKVIDALNKGATEGENTAEFQRKKNELQMLLYQVGNILGLDEVLEEQRKNLVEQQQTEEKLKINKDLLINLLSEKKLLMDNWDSKTNVTTFAKEISKAIDGKSLKINSNDIENILLQENYTLIDKNTKAKIIQELEGEENIKKENFRSIVKYQNNALLNNQLAGDDKDIKEKNRQINELLIKQDALLDDLSRIDKNLIKLEYKDNKQSTTNLKVVSNQR